MANNNDDLLECLTSAPAKRDQAIESNTTTATKVCKKRVDIVITVTRKQSTNDSTLGTFDARRVGDAAGTVTGGSLEPKPGTYDLGKGNGTKTYPITAGTYPGRVRGSPGAPSTGKNRAVAAPYSRHAVEIQNVPNFQDVLIHIGTVSHDTEGCILVGGATALVDNPIMKGKKVIRVEHNGRITAGTTRQKNWDLLDFIYTVKKENDGEMPRITVIVKDP